MQDTCMELFEKLSRLQWLLHRHHLQSHAEHGPLADTSRGQGRVLALLRLQPEISTKDLAYLMGIRQQSLGELLGKLEKGGFLTRGPSEGDKRVIMVRLTDKGREEQAQEKDFGDLFGCLTPEEQEAFGDYLDRVIAALEAQVGTPEQGEQLANWMRAARTRMGDEQFERLMELRGGMHPFREGFGHSHGGFHGAHFSGGHDRRRRPDAPPPPPKGPHDPEDPQDR